MKKILYIQHSGQMGGAPNSLSYILKALDRSIIKPELINIQDGPSNQLFEEVGVPPIILRKLRPFHGSTVVNMNIKMVIRNLYYFIPTIIAGYKSAKAIQPDLIHLNSTCMVHFAIGAKLYNRKLPVIAHVREPIRSDWYGTLLRFLVKKTVNGLIAISKFDLNSIRLKPQSHIKNTIIYNFVKKGFSRNDNKNGIREKLGIKKEDIVFLYLARFSVSNGWKELLHLAEKVNKTRSNCHFILAGAPNDLKVDLYNNSQIHLLPFSKEIESLLNTADIFVCPFVQPHFARGIIEAASWGLPVIANNIGGVNELVEHNNTGFLYNDEETFISYAQSLIDNKQIREQFGKAAKLMANRKFNFETNSKKTIDFYKHFLSFSE